MVVIPTKYQEAQLPSTEEEATRLAQEADASAQMARDADMNGSARQFELMAKLLRFYARYLSYED